MLGLIIGNVDFNGALIVLGLCTGATITAVAFMQKKTPEDYEVEKLKIEKDAEKQLVAYKRDR